MTPKPGLAPKLTARAPEGADELKARIGALATATAQIRALRRGMSKSFYDIGGILVDIRDRELYKAKNYGSFEAFVEREVELGKHLGMRLARAATVFQKPAALAAGLERVSAAIAALDGEAEPTNTPPQPTAPSTSGLIRSPIPFHKR